MDLNISNKPELVKTILDELRQQLLLQTNPPLNPPLFTEDNILLIESKLFYYLTSFIREELVQTLITLNQSDRTCMQWAVREVVGRIGALYGLPKGAVVNYKTGENMVKSGLCEVLWSHAKRVEEPRPTLLSWFWKSAPKVPAESQLKIDGHGLDKIQSLLVENTIVALSERAQKTQIYQRDQLSAAATQKKLKHS